MSLLALFLPPVAAERVDEPESNDFIKDYLAWSGDEFRRFTWKPTAPGGSCNKRRMPEQAFLFTCLYATAFVTYKLHIPSEAKWRTVQLLRNRGIWPDKSRWKIDWKGRKATVLVIVNPKGRGGAQTVVEEVRANGKFYVRNLDALFPIGATAEICSERTSEGCSYPYEAEIIGDPYVEGWDVLIPIRRLDDGSQYDEWSYYFHIVRYSDGTSVEWPDDRIDYP